MAFCSGLSGAGFQPAGFSCCSIDPAATKLHRLEACAARILFIISLENIYGILHRIFLCERSGIFS
jgi:hypothetical protein